MQFRCPLQIMRVRMALAQTSIVRALRPCTLQRKIIAVGGITTMTNIPCGMLRDQVEKFSTPWFVTLHATVPLVAMLRNAVGMPNITIIFTIAAAIIGQMIGAHLANKIKHYGYDVMLVSTYNLF